MLKAEPPAGIARALRHRNEKLYSHAALANLFGISKATAFRLTQKDGGSNG